MPGKNVEKQYIPDTFYHVYNRGVNKRPIFEDDEDYRVFLNLFKRYLGVEVMHDNKKREYPNYHGDVDLVAYCLMPNHFHILLYVGNDSLVIQRVMQSVITSYVMYFNKKHKRVGRLFGKQYRAVPITEEAQLWHITRYIHLNPIDLGADYHRYDYSSIGYYTRKKSSDWVSPKKILEMFEEEGEDYGKFLEDYIDKRAELKVIHEELY